MASVCYRCYSCGLIFYTEQDAGKHVSNCTKSATLQIAESSEAEILDANEQSMEDQEKPTDEPTDSLDEVNLEGKTVFVWNKVATLLLIKLYKKHESKFHSQAYKKKQVWQMIASEVKALGYRVTVLQCENRWKTLMSSYRKTKFLNQLAGNHQLVVNRKTCNYFTELDALVRSKRMMAAVGAHRRQAETSSPPDKTHNRTVRKKDLVGGSSDLCEILRKMEERCEQRHQERMALQREMMNSHKQFMQSILDMLMDGNGT